MGKLKKQPKNAFFFFVMSEKEKAEAEGYLVQGGFQIYSHRFGNRWTSMTREEKVPYEVMAKEAKEQEKYNINNKFTVTGESYAQVHQKVLDQKTAHDEMENFIGQLVCGPESGDCRIIFMKALYSVEEIIDQRSRLYWPSELCMAVFSLKGGIKSIYTQLVDTGKNLLITYKGLNRCFDHPDTIPTGYASQAMENCEDASLPMPGDRSVFGAECRDYLRILKNINGFANHWLKHGYDVPGHGKVFFAMENEIAPLVSCIQWMVNQLHGKEREKYQRFVDNLKVYRISKLIVTMAEEANRINPSYQNYLVQYKLETAADTVVNKGNYEYSEEITCGYHRLDNACMKMHNCAQNIVMRRIYMLFLEFLPAYKYDLNDRHSVYKLGKGAKKGPVGTRKRGKGPAKEKVKMPAEPAWLKSEEMGMYTWDSLASGTSSSTTTFPKWGERPAPSASFEKDDFPTLGASGGTNVAPVWGMRASTSSASRTAPQFNNSFGSSCGGGGASGGRGRLPCPPPPAISTSFLEDDEFPSLGSSSTIRGRGRRY